MDRRRVKNEDENNLLNEKPKAQVKAIIRKQECLRKKKSKSISSLIFADNGGVTDVSPITAASNGMLLRVSNKLLKSNKK